MPDPQRPLATAHQAHLAEGDAAIARALALVRFLRDNCPWDARQDSRSLHPYLLEEAHEVADAVLAQDDVALCGELGDLLLNVAFQIVLAEERGSFGAAEVTGELEAKMRLRHPHIYGEEHEPPDWERLKAAERYEQAVDTEAPFAGVPLGLEPLDRALRVQQRASALGFDWPETSGVLAKLREEVDELERVLRSQTQGPDTGPAIEEEIGDLLFAAVNVARLVEVHPSSALFDATEKFGRRFERLLEVLREAGVAAGTASLADFDRAWNQVKVEEGRAAD